MPDSFVHSHASHCESGVMSSLLRHHGLPMSEAMAFGLASALSFAYLPFIRINGLPLVSYRMPPRAIIRGLERSLGLDMRFETFRSAPAGMERLDALLDAGKLVGLQTSVFWLRISRPICGFISTRTTCSSTGASSMTTSSATRWRRRRFDALGKTSGGRASPRGCSRPRDCSIS